MIYDDKELYEELHVLLKTLSSSISCERGIRSHFFKVMDCNFIL